MICRISSGKWGWLVSLGSYMRFFLSVSQEIGLFWLQSRLGHYSQHHRERLLVIFTVGCVLSIEYLGGFDDGQGTRAETVKMGTFVTN